MKTTLKNLLVLLALCTAHNANAVFFDWAKSYNGGATDKGLHSMTDASGNAYLTGVSTLAGGDKIISSAYADNGTLLWQRTANTFLPGAVKQVERDAALNTFVLCQISSSSFTLIRYNANAVEKWRKNYSNFFLKFKVGDPNALYLCGLTATGVVMRRLNKNSGASSWTRSYADATLLPNSYHSDFTIDVNSNLYFSGTSSNGTVDDYDYKMVKLTKNGVLVYNIQFDAGSTEDEETFKIAVNNAGELFIAGDYDCYIPVRDFVTMSKFSATGAHLWSTFYTGTGPNGYQTMEVQVGPDGNPVVVGTVYDFYNVTPDGETDRIQVGKFNSATGAQLFLVYPGDPTYTNVDIIERPKCMTIDASNNIYIGGTSNVYAGVDVAPDRWLALKVLGATGVREWVEAGVSNDPLNEMLDVAVTSAHDSYWAGTEVFSGTADMWLTKYCEVGCFSPRLGETGEAIASVVVFPNPSTTAFTLKCENGDLTSTLSVYDLTGKLVEEHSGNMNTFSFGENLSAGTYIVRFLNATENKVIRVVKNQ